MAEDDAAEDLSRLAAAATEAALRAAGGRADVCWVAAVMLLGLAARRLGRTPGFRDDLLMLAEHAARQVVGRADRVAGDGP